MKKLFIKDVLVSYPDKLDKRFDEIEDLVKSLKQKSPNLCKVKVWETKRHDLAFHIYHSPVFLNIVVEV